MNDKKIKITLPAIRQIHTSKHVSGYKSTVCIGDESDKWFNAAFCFYFLLYFGYIFLFNPSKYYIGEIMP